ncbi:hypothetical protein RHMOL_Rhmol06G0183800 [Rhododendron molle]|uniref:Uncharacterized protein n=1 Tax=Rhododendron molle TaxID=49168 RepID=A0ACC0NE91_RHOML|nr:hypothetical protein RHMOL_Rhmol06G0183800 [Rhododendron molle]
MQLFRQLPILDSLPRIYCCGVYCKASFDDGGNGNLIDLELDVGFVGHVVSQCSEAECPWVIALLLLLLLLEFSNNGTTLDLVLHLLVSLTVRGWVVGGGGKSCGMDSIRLPGASAGYRL